LLLIAKSTFLVPEMLFENATRTQVIISYAIGVMMLTITPRGLDARAFLHCYKIDAACPLQRAKVLCLFELETNEPPEMLF
jgi:hypothetical protein